MISIAVNKSDGRCVVAALSGHTHNMLSVNVGQSQDIYIHAVCSPLLLTVYLIGKYEI